MDVFRLPFHGFSPLPASIIMSPVIIILQLGFRFANKKGPSDGALGAGLAPGCLARYQLTRMARRTRAARRAADDV